jgi:hypothetical protein
MIVSPSHGTSRIDNLLSTVHEDDRHGHVGFAAPSLL